MGHLLKLATIFLRCIPAFFRSRNEHREYVNYYNNDRVHTELQDSPVDRPAEHRPTPEAQVVGLHRVTRKLRFLPCIIDTSREKQHDLPDHHRRQTTLAPPDG
jgi:hypothetical protein